MANRLRQKVVAASTSRLRASSSSSVGSTAPRHKDFSDLQDKVDSIIECYRQLVSVMNTVCEQVAGLVISACHGQTERFEEPRSRSPEQPETKDMVFGWQKKEASLERTVIGGGIVAQLLADAESVAQISSCKELQLNFNHTVRGLSQRIEGVEQSLAHEALRHRDMIRLSDELGTLVSDVASLRGTVGDLSRDRQRCSQMEENFAELTERIGRVELELQSEMESTDYLARCIQHLGDLQGVAMDRALDKITARLNQLEDQVPQTLTQLAHDLETTIKRLFAEPLVVSELRAAPARTASAAVGRGVSIPSDATLDNLHPSCTDASNAQSPVNIKVGEGTDEIIMRMQHLDLQMSVQAALDTAANLHKTEVDAPPRRPEQISSSLRLQRRCLSLDDLQEAHDDSDARATPTSLQTPGSADTSVVQDGPGMRRLDRLAPICRRPSPAELLPTFET